MNIITLYHGTNQSIDTIDLARCMPFKDFGRGFYLTDIYDQALQMGHRRVKMHRAGRPIVMRYDFDASVLTSGELQVKIFEGPTAEWAEFILANRMMPDFRHPYDIVMGPVADDGVILQLDLYQQRIITLSQLVEALTFSRLNKQYCFTSLRALSYLTAYGCCQDTIPKR